MCGIAGEILFNGGVADAGAVARMMASQERRGPDACGQLMRGRVGLGHQRLKIIDLSDRSAQPLSDPELLLDIVFNGCIYNYQALRGELETKGYRFFSGGDTEVIVKAYAQWGERCVERFFGMFAFAIWERDSGRVFLARDRLGIKPLYLAPVEKGLRFASTLPALLAAGGVDTEIDPIGLHHYMTLHAVVPAPRTVLRGVKKLEPGTTLMIEPDGAQRVRRYWDVRFQTSEADRKLSLEDWQERSLSALRRAVKRRTEQGGKRRRRQFLHRAAPHRFD